MMSIGTNILWLNSIRYVLKIVNTALLIVSLMLLKVDFSQNLRFNRLLKRCKMNKNCKEMMIKLISTILVICIYC